MSEFNAYLEKLRAALDVSPSRADEILAEARTHLEAKAVALEASGLSRAEAAREAVASFGEADEMAAQLATANGRWRESSPLRVLAGLAVMVVVTVALLSLAGDVRWLGGLRGRLEHLSVLARSSGGMLLWLTAMAPAALLAGMIGGRRHWWVAVTPALLFAILLPINAYARSDGMPSIVTVAFTVLYPAAALLTWGALGRLGARHAGNRALQHWALFVVAPLYATLTAVALGTSLSGLTAAFMTVTFCEIGLVALLVIALRRGRLDPNLLARCFNAIAVLGAVLIVASVAAGAEVLYLARHDGRFTTLAWALAASATTALVAALFGYFRWQTARNETGTPAPE